ncbi:hypothetical protein OCOJLMKI_3340 [Methylobacterium iners]|uniref:Uncharacterized protein n=1 Tax=Methylobacterium iners TaxID=418707 RepID=A0ABQ4S1R7_9HYPH|nr:hypothetical protein OCOJLMKI_3340 [Methylobacterium iners]
MFTPGLLPGTDAGLGLPGTAWAGRSSMSGAPGTGPGVMDGAVTPVFPAPPLGASFSAKADPASSTAAQVLKTIVMRAMDSSVYPYRRPNSRHARKFKAGAFASAARCYALARQPMVRKTTALAHPTRFERVTFAFGDLRKQWERASGTKRVWRPKLDLQLSTLCSPWEGPLPGSLMNQKLTQRTAGGAHPLRETASSFMGVLCLAATLDWLRR